LLMTLCGQIKNCIARNVLRLSSLTTKRSRMKKAFKKVEE
jgi:hypothetical protein